MTISPQKVAAGRKLPLDKVRDVASGRVWSGADAKTRGLVDSLGGFWTAAGDGGGPGRSSSRAAWRSGSIPGPTGLLGRLRALSGGLDASLGLLGRIESLLNLPAAAGGPGARLAICRMARPAARSSSRRRICHGRDARITGFSNETACSRPRLEL